MKVAVGCDHGGFVLKDAVISTLEELGAQVVDMGTYSTESVDYPVYGKKVADAVANGECDLGVVMCGTGIGAAVVTDEFMAEMTRRHNNANIIALGGRVITPEKAKLLVKAWYTAEFEGGRHQKRIDMITQIENEQK